MAPDGCHTSHHLIEQIQIQKQKAIAALDLAARNAVESARELQQAKDTITLLESGIQLPDKLMSSQQTFDHEIVTSDSQTAILRLQGEIASLRSEMDAMKSSHTAMLNTLRSQLHAANYARIAAESQLKHLQVGFLQAEKSIQSSLAEFKRVVYAAARQMPVATPPPPTISAGDERSPLIHLSNGTDTVAPAAPPDDLPPDSLTAISDGERRAAKRIRKSPRFDRQTLLNTLRPGDGTVSAVLRLINVGLDEKTLSVDDLLQIAADSVNGVSSLSSTEQHGRMLSDLFCQERIRSLGDKFLIRLWRLIILASDTSSMPILTAMNGFTQLCLSSNRVDLLRVFIFDLLRLRSCFEIELFAIIFRIVPNVFDVACRSALRDAIVAIVCDALSCLPDNHIVKRDILVNPFWANRIQQHDPAQFSSAVQLAINQVVSDDADRVSDGTRALELIALSQGWLWTCTAVLGPVWQRIRATSESEIVARLITVVGIIGRTSYSDSANSSTVEFLQQIVSGLHSFLDAVFPIEIQVAAADALVVLANGRLSNLRDLYKWFVTVPNASRSLLPLALRDDITFIGKQLSVR